MSVKLIRLSSQAKEQLIRLKTRTGIPQWNSMKSVVKAAFASRAVM